MKPERRTAHRLLDILDAITDIKAALADQNYDTFRSHRLVRPAVERYFEIISEASRHLPASITESDTTIAWRRVADLGNVLRHAYHDTDPAILWGIYLNHLDALEAAIRHAQADFPDVGT
jgi:uncharacterized protein with HEPN domain